MNDPRLATIEQTLTDAFQPTLLKVMDESHLHIGHPGATPGKLHIAITITSDRLNGYSKLQQHRMIYHALQPFIAHDLHAIRLEIN